MQATLKAWVSSPNALKAFLTAPSDGEKITQINLSNSDMAEYGWIELGLATIVLDPPRNDVLINAGLKAVDAALGKATTDAAALKQTLLAIGYQEK